MSRFPLYAVTSQEMAQIDLQTQENYKYPAILLMENAALNCYRILDKKFYNTFTEKSHTVFLCGKGNNGGDALAMARHHFLKNRKGVILFTNSSNFEISENNIDSPFARNAELCKKLGIEILFFDTDREKAFSALKTCHVIVDGLAGTGINGSLRELEAKLCKAVNTSSAFICSIDVPSGIGDNFKTAHPSIKADLTITIALPKLSLYYPEARKRCGTILFAEAAFPPAILQQCSKFYRISQGSLDDLKQYINFPPPWSYKNKQGHTAIFAGSKGKSGAAILCALAASKSMAGLVSLFTENNIVIPATTALPSVMTNTFDSFEKKDYPAIAEKYDSFILGPGWGLSPSPITENKKEFLKYLLEETEKPLVLDADAITMLSELIAEKNSKKDFLFKNPNCIITPHIGEFSKLVKTSSNEILENPMNYMLSFCGKTGFTLVLKSHITWICSCNNFFILDSMNPALGTAGSGDVLAGITGAFLANFTSMPAEKAAIAAILTHSMAGKLCFEKKGFFNASELPKYISKVLKKGYTSGK